MALSLDCPFLNPRPETLNPKKKQSFCREEPGNFGNPLPLVGDDYSDEMRSRELNNGRIAMFAAIGQIAAGLYTGKSGIEQFGA